MKKFYIVDKNGIYTSADGKTRFTCLTGKVLFDYLKSDEGSKKEFDIDFDDNGDEIGIEIPGDKLNRYLKDKERKKYVFKTQKTMGYAIISLNSDFEGKDGEKMTFEEAIADDSDDFAEEIALRANIKTLRQALDTLTSDEMNVIYLLYLSDKPMTERQVAIKRGVTQQAIHKYKCAILKKLRKFF